MSTALALIAHDLKNALGALESELSALANSPCQASAERAHTHCADLRQQFTQFLTLYSAEAGELRALCEDESPTDTLHHLQSHWQRKSQADQPAVQITIEGADTAPPFWYFDRRLVQLALDAAMHNALRFARKQVTVRVFAQDGWLVWQVADDGDGPGAADPARPHATGLGTSLCAAVAKAHQLGERCGRISLTREPGSQQTVFELHLP